MADLYSSQKSVSAGTYGIIVSLNYIDQNTLDKNPKKEELKILSVPVGFIIFMGCLQLGYYPMQFFQVFFL